MSLTVEEKVSQAELVIEEGLKNARQPAIMCSFGKDSMVLLHLVRKLKELPIIFHREPYQQHKYAFAHRIMEDWDLRVYDYPPILTEVNEKLGHLEIIKHHQIGQRTCMIPVRTVPPFPDSLVCGLEDIYNCPKGNFDYPWDLVFHGHKSSDVDMIYGPVPLACNVAKSLGSASAIFPLRHFSDQDIWEYTERNGLPIHHERYEKVEGTWRERESKDRNPDFVNACTACMRKDGGPVPCPKFGGLTINNVAAQLRWAPDRPLNYLCQ